MKPRVNRTESAVGFVILLGLLGICIWVYERQSRFDPSVLVVTAPQPPVVERSASAPAVGSPFQPFISDTLSPLSPPEQFGAETLSEKIDGKAELYLSSGFVSLQCQRFARAEAGGRAWLEIFVYDMGDSRNAFSVFSSQRRAEGEDVDLTRFAYRTANALFMAHGKDYVEIVGSEEALIGEILAVGRRFVDARPLPLAGGEMGELGVFPPDGLDPASITLLSSNVFGYEKLDDTYTAAYTSGKQKLMAFVSRRSSADEARSLASDYERFLLDNGGSVIESGLSIPGVRVIQLFDMVEVFFSKGDRLAGVHEADDLHAAGELALKLYGALP
jgi:hypothetical protein